jgi:site-specific DNA recombinase
MAAKRSGIGKMNVTTKYMKGRGYMQGNRKVTQIPATITQFSSLPLGESRNKRVAGYARVSTDKDEQFSSYEAQVDYYTNYIQGHENWKFVKVYTDAGISGTSTAKREGFKRMIADALDNKIDLIVTKSVSRFARNTVDSLVTIRKLKEAGVEVYFEKENIYTFDSKGEMLLTIMSSLAQEESRSISENVTWGIRKRFSDGKVTIPYKAFLGYEKGEDGNLAVNQDEAKIVKFIFGSSLIGKSPFTIAKELTRKGIPTVRGKSTWRQTTIMSILSNEKYAGNAILQKTYTPDFLSKKRIVNRGEVPKYYVENSHEGIITEEQFDLVQQQLKQLDGQKRHYSTGMFSGKVKCGDCGSFFGSKVWHSTDKYRSIIWQCNNKFVGELKCNTPHLTEDKLKAVYLRAVNKLFSDRDEVLLHTEKILIAELDVSGLEKEHRGLEREMVVVSELVKKSLSAPVFSTDEKAKSDYDELSKRYETIQIRLGDISSEIADKKQRTTAIKKFCNEVKKTDDYVTEFSPEQFMILVDCMSVNAKNDIRVLFRDGTEIVERGSY